MRERQREGGRSQRRWKKMFRTKARKPYPGSMFHEIRCQSYAALSPLTSLLSLFIPICVQVGKNGWLISINSEEIAGRLDGIASQA